MVGFCDLVRVGIARVSKKTAVKEIAHMMHLKILMPGENGTKWSIMKYMKLKGLMSKIKNYLC
jgi:hypothetical protein